MKKEKMKRKLKMKCLTEEKMYSISMKDMTTVISILSAI